MARLILKSPYMKPNRSAHASRYVRYIATRDGVEFAEDTRKYTEAMVRQKNTIDQIIKAFPDTKESLEYGTYRRRPNRENADKFILSAAEEHPELLGSRQSYVSYIATRPGVVKKKHNGLFTDEGIAFSMEQVMQEVGSHNGNVWTHIISLRREDARRLGYDNVDDWMALLRSQRNVFARNMKIKPENFRWYAAFHNAEDHPHVHMIAYSVDPKEAYLSRKGIENIKRSLASEIFRQELICVYQKQTGYRDALRDRAKTILSEIAEQVKSGNYTNSQIEHMLLELAARLRRLSSRRVYGYLPADLKALVDRITDELEKDERISKLYDLWYDQRYEILKTYTDTLPEKIPLSQNDEFKKIRNAVIREAVMLLSEPETFAMVDSNGKYSYHTASAVIRLLDEMSRILDERIAENDMLLAQTDSKERQKIEEKMQAHGLRH